MDFQLYIYNKRGMIMKRYKLITEDLQKNLIEFLDEIQFDAAGSDDKESMHVVNFCSWAIKELVESYDAQFKAKYNNKKGPNKIRTFYNHSKYLLQDHLLNLTTHPNLLM